ncbi:MAG: hypothetical protein WEC84_02465 [Candidatus Andersenbacteria bacterium]
MIDLGVALTIGHLFGVILGAGGAFTSDLMFFKSVRDRVISKVELDFMRLGSKLVWTGLIIILLTGTSLFLMNMDTYLASPKFLVKVTIVGIIISNGFFFHLSHIPRISRHTDTHYSSSDEFMRKRPWLLGSGVISMVSWISAFLLGSLRSIPFSYVTAMGIYLAVIIIGITIAYSIRNHLLPHHKH